VEQHSYVRMVCPGTGQRRGHDRVESVDLADPNPVITALFQRMSDLGENSDQVPVLRQMDCGHSARWWVSPPPPPRWCGDDSMTCPLTSADCREATQATTAATTATQRGSNLAITWSERLRSSVRRVRAPGAMALAVS